MKMLCKIIISNFIVLFVVNSSFANEAPQGLMKQFLAQKDRIRVKRVKARDLISEAHNYFNAEAYRRAEAYHRKGRTLEREIKDLEQQLAKLVLPIFRTQVKKLSNENFKARRSASNHLQQLGPRIRPLLTDLSLKNIDPETNSRIKGLLTSFKNIEIDEQGRFLQWAKTANASSEYSPTSWSAKQATGKPDTHQAGDLKTAWASKPPDAGKEWLELTFEKAIHPVTVRIHETYNPGAVAKVEARDEKGKLHTLWEGKDTTQLAPAFLEVNAPKGLGNIQTSVIRITLNTKAVNGWNEIDAVQLIGFP